MARRRLACATAVAAGLPGVTQVQGGAGPAQVDVRAEPVGDLRQVNRVLVWIACLLTAGGAADVLCKEMSCLIAEPAEHLIGAGRGRPCQGARTRAAELARADPGNPTSA